MSKLTTRDLAAEINLEIESLIPLLEKMGLKKVTPDSEVPDTIAVNVRLAVSARQKALSMGSSAAKDDAIASHIEPKLTKNQVKEIAGQTKLTQVLIRQLDQELHNRSCQLSFLQGYQEIERQQQQKLALEAGQLTGQLQIIQRRSQELDAEEALLIEQARITENQPIAIAKKMGIDIEGILASLQVNSEKRAQTSLSHESAVQKIHNGSDLTDEEIGNPFTWLAYRNSQGM
jgi:hypothetical protein